MSTPILINFRVLHAAVADRFWHHEFLGGGARRAVEHLGRRRKHCTDEQLWRLGAIGVLVGGWIAARTERHALVAATSMLMTALACILIGNHRFSALCC